MTDFNKRLDEIITLAIRRGIKIGKLMEKNNIAFTDFTTDKEYHDLAQLFRDTVKEAKPKELSHTAETHVGMNMDAYKHYLGVEMGNNTAIDQYESNLLRMIGGDNARD